MRNSVIVIFSLNALLCVIAATYFFTLDNVAAGNAELSALCGWVSALIAVATQPGENHD